MTKQQAMQETLEFWVKAYGYEDVIEALIDACEWWALMDTDDLPQHTTPARWSLRAHALWMILKDDAKSVEETP